MSRSQPADSGTEPRVSRLSPSAGSVESGHVTEVGLDARPGLKERAKQLIRNTAFNQQWRCTHVNNLNQGRNPQRPLPRPNARSVGQPTVPRFDIWENDDEMVLYGDLPGVMPEDLDVRFENPVLTIHGKVSPRHNDIKFLHGEYGIGDFHRTFTIGEAIDTEKSPPN